MRRLLAEAVKAGMALAVALVAAAGLEAQEGGVPQVLSKMVSVGAGEARLTLELASGRSMELTLVDGEVRMDDEVLGLYTPGDPLFQSWRELVVSTLALEDDALLEALVDWSPPEGLEGDRAEVARRMDEFLTANFDTTALRARALEAEGAAGTEVDGLGALEGLALLSRLDALSGLSGSVAQLGNRVRIVVDDDLVVPAGTEIPGSILVVDGSLEVEGTVRGDILVVDGDVELLPGSLVTGTLSLTRSDLDDAGGRVDGGIRELDALSGPDMESRLRQEILRELRDEMDFDIRIGEDREWGGTVGGAFRRLFRGLGNLVGDFATILVLGLAGVAFFHFAGSNMEAVAETARTTPGKAAMVGFAGMILSLPVWLVGMLGLAITIIGIPALLVWVPLFPAAVVLAALMGYLAVARNLGVWLERQDYPYTDWVRLTNPVTLVLGGLVVLAAPFMAANILGMVGVLGILGVLLKIAGFAFASFATAVGFGAVLLTRGGRRPEEWGTEFFTGGWRDRRWGRRKDPEAEAFDAELAREESPEEPSAQAAAGSEPDGSDQDQGEEAQPEDGKEES